MGVLFSRMKKYLPFIPKAGRLCYLFPKKSERELSVVSGHNVCFGQQKCPQGVRFRKKYLSHICIKSLVFLADMRQ